MSGPRRRDQSKDLSYAHEGVLTAESQQSILSFQQVLNSWETSHLLKGKVLKCILVIQIYQFKPMGIGKKSSSITGTSTKLYTFTVKLTFYKNGEVPGLTTIFLGF